MRTILIVGANSTIAKDLAYKFAQENHNLILVGRDEEELRKTQADLAIRYEVAVHINNFDAENEIEYRHIFQKSVQQFGEVDGIVVAHGYLGEQKAAEAEFSETRKIFEVNFLSYVAILNEAANYFEQKKRGFICAISSVAGDRGRQSNYIYGTSKGALTVYLQGLRNRLSLAGVQVLTVKPGFVDTKMTYGLINDSLLVSSSEKAANLIFSSIQKNKDVVYTPYWKYVMLIIKLIPEKVFKKLKL